MYGIYLSASGAEAFNKYMEVLSNNIANADTAGFKRDLAILKARPAEAMVQGKDTLGSGSLNNVGGGVQMVETETDFSPGAYKQTGVSTDLAIADSDGSSFFVVDRNGEKLLTRAGNFTVTAQGDLQTQSGLNVLSANGAPIRVDPRYAIQVTEDGRIQQPETGLDIPIGLEQAASWGDLVKVGASLFSPLAETRATPPAERQVRQGILEQSGANPIREMMELIQVTRGYEANVRMIQHQDSTTGSLINRVLGG